MFAQQRNELATALRESHHQHQRADASWKTARRAAIEQYEDGLARDAKDLAPKFAHRVAELKQQFETGGQDHESADHAPAGASRVF